MNYIRIIAAVAILLFASTAARAALVTITPDDCINGSDGSDGCWTTDTTSALDANDIEGMVGVTDLVLLYKAEVEGSESGLYASSYDTTFSNSDADPEDALIDYIGGDLIACDSCYLVIKDGIHSPAQYIFDLSDLSYLSLGGEWDGVTSLFVEGFWLDGGAISHIAIFGTISEVPLPAAFWLFGTALIGFVGISRRRSI